MKTKIQPELIGLTEVTRPDKSFPERFVDAVFNNQPNRKAREIFTQAFSDGGYSPTFTDAQHWSVDVLADSELERVEEFSDLDLITEIFCRFVIPSREGKLSLLAAKKMAVKKVKDFYAGSDTELMFDEPPRNQEWYAAHIYRMGEEFEQSLEDYLADRVELEKLAGNVDDFFVSENESERMVERREALISSLNTGVKIGFLFRDAWWKRNHEGAATKYYQHVKQQKSGSRKGGVTTANKAAARRDYCLKYVAIAYRKKGFAFFGADIKIKAATIREIALSDRPTYFSSPQGGPLSHQWFLSVLEGFQADGQLGKAIESAVIDKAQAN